SESKRLAREVTQLKTKLAMGGGAGADSIDTIEVAGIKLARRQLADLDKQGLRQLADALKATIKSGIVVLASANDGKVQMVVAVTLTVAFAAPAAAQIYSWHDANGQLVLSDRPLGSVERTYDVAKAETVRATRPVAAQRSQVYDRLIAEHAQVNDVRADLVRAVVQVESAFNPYARSPKGALGLMQLMPATIRQFGVINPFNPAE